MSTATKKFKPLKDFDIDAIRLASGGHSAKDGFCVMELSAYLAREPWSDAPACVSPAIASFLRSWNDDVDDEFRQKLKPYAQRVIGTKTTDADEETRGWLATDWLVRVQTPAWLDLAGLSEHAAKLQNLPALTNSEIALSVQSVLNEARSASAAASDAARAAARAAAWAAASAAASDAASAAASDAAWAAASDAAWAAARAAARAAAWAAASDAAWAAARAAASDAAWAAARAAAWAAASDAASDAAWAAVQPTVEALQTSAFDLLDRMIAVSSVQPPSPSEERT